MRLDDWPPLWMPRHSVRAILALLVVGTILFNFLANPTTVTAPSDTGDPVVTEVRELSDTEVMLVLGVLVAYGLSRALPAPGGDDLIETLTRSASHPGTYSEGYRAAAEQMERQNLVRELNEVRQKVEEQDAARDSRRKATGNSPGRATTPAPPDWAPESAEA